MQDITEQQELAQEISDAISKPVGLGEQFDEVGESSTCTDLQIRFCVKASVNLKRLHTSLTLLS